jgi:alanine racemase
MDTLSVDITDIDGIKVGDEAVLWGPELPALEVANWSDTIPYHLFTSITQRVTRCYL